MGLRKAGRRVYLGKPEYRRREVQLLSLREVRQTFPPGARLRVRRALLSALGATFHKGRISGQVVARFYHNLEGKRFVLCVDLPQLQAIVRRDIRQGQRRVVGEASIWLVTPEFGLGRQVASNELVMERGQVGGLGARLSADLLDGPLPVAPVRPSPPPKSEWHGHFFTKMFTTAKQIAARRYGMPNISAEADTAAMKRQYEVMGFGPMQRVPLETLPVRWRGSQRVRPRTGKPGRAQR